MEMITTVMLKAMGMKNKNKKIKKRMNSNKVIMNNQRMMILTKKNRRMTKNTNKQRMKKPKSFKTRSRVKDSNNKLIVMMTTSKTVKTVTKIVNNQEKRI